MTLCLVLSLSPLPPPALSCLLASISPPPAGSWEEQAAMMIAWRVSSPACLPVVDFPMPPHRCRLVGRGGERAIFVPGSVLAGGSVLVSSCRLVVRGSCPRRIASMNCPSCLILFAFYHFSSRRSSRLSSRRASRCSCLALDMFFLCFSVHSLASCACLICPRARLVQSSRRPSHLSSRLVSSCVSGGGGLSCAACLICSRWRFRLVLVVSSGGTGSGAGR